VPRGLYDRNPDHYAVKPDQYSLIDREVRRFRKTRPRTNTVAADAQKADARAMIRTENSCYQHCGRPRCELSYSMPI
jgi:hypothetical protein